VTAYPAPCLYVDGEWIAATSAGTVPVINPSDESVLGLLPVAGPDEIACTLASSRRAFEQWRAVSPLRRAEIILEAARLLRSRIESIAPLSTLDEGQPIADSRNYLLRAAEILEWDANEGRRAYGRTVPSESGLRQTIVREPVGPVAAFSPWNAPLFTPCRKIGSPLAAGCSVILKGAEEAPGATIELVRAFADAGAPKGLINLLFGEPASLAAALIDSPIVRMVSFTGSLPVGRQLAERSARLMKPCVMELGGHAPVIVCDDADPLDAARRIVAAKFRNAGQACIAPSRIYVHRAVREAFVDALVAETVKIKVGDGFEPGVTMGPLANARRLAAVTSLVDDARQRGAMVATGGQRIGTRGYFYAPTVLLGPPAESRVLHEEPFGPVLSVESFDTLEDALTRANSLPYGLAAYGFTQSARVAERLASQLECGAVGINHCVVSTSGIPFGGVKDSGYGREGGSEGVLAYTIGKTVTHLIG